MSSILEAVWQSDYRSHGGREEDCLASSEAEEEEEDTHTHTHTRFPTQFLPGSAQGRGFHRGPAPPPSPSYRRTLRPSNTHHNRDSKNPPVLNSTVLRLKKVNSHDVDSTKKYTNTQCNVHSCPYDACCDVPYICLPQPCTVSLTQNLKIRNTIHMFGYIRYTVDLI